MKLFVEFHICFHYITHSTITRVPFHSFFIYLAISNYKIPETINIYIPIFVRSNNSFLEKLGMSC